MGGFGVGLLILFLVFALTLFAVLALGSRLVGSRNLPRVASVLSVATMVVTALVTSYAVLVTLLEDELSVTVPVAELPVRIYGDAQVDPPVATIRSGGFDRVTVVAEGIGTQPRVAYVISALLSGVTLIGVAWVVWRVARSLGAHDPFKLSSDALRSTAVIVAVGGLLASMAGSLGDVWASHDLFFTAGGSWTATDGQEGLADFGWPDPAPFSVVIPFWPIAAGLVLELLAQVFRHGRRLREDTEGLV